MRELDPSNTKLTCLQCGFTWQRRYNTNPRNCHHCKTKRWNKEGPGKKVYQGQLLKILLNLIASETDNCIEWPYARVADEYGVITLNKKPYRTTHVSWEIANGTQVPKGKKVCHICDNPPCINPRHLFLGTNIDNMQDAKEKDRLARGEDHGLAKLTEDAVREIRQSFTSQRKLAAKFGVATQTIYCVRIGKTWTHVA